MCGIIGIVSQSPLKDRTWFTAGRDAMGHRGPDDQGEWWSSDGRVGFAHCRLAVIDLSPSGHQPMQDTSGDLTITFNGEIYNFPELRRDLEIKGHAFRTGTATEVILAAYREWSTDAVLHLKGMFAFVLFDSRTQQIFMARDRAGEKPLYYSFADGCLRFASELKALMIDPVFPRQIDPEALDCYLSMGYIPGERCILRGVMKLPPAHTLVFNLSLGTVNIRRYWRMFIRYVTLMSIRGVNPIQPH